MIAHNRERYPNSEWTAGDIRSAPLEDGTFGGIISWGVVEHDEAGPQEALREFYRLLKPGACCIATVPIDHVRQRRTGLLDNPSNSGNFFQYYFSVSEFREEMEKAGFETVIAQPVPIRALGIAAPRLYRRFLRTRWFFIVRMAALLVPKSKACGMLVVIGRKP